MDNDDQDSRIIRPNQKPQIAIPKRIIKEQLDQYERECWEDPGRFLKKKQRALQYIPVRAPGLPDADKLLSEVKRVFHDDLATDPEIKEAIQRAVWQVQVDQREAERGGRPVETPALEPGVGPIKAGEKAPRGPVRGVDESDETLRDLEYQRKEEETEP